ncbi:unnamed protein product [Paramecium primaurelia]|uniref:Uncharacterized protein n=1 Tax=Paramecium primaurelia TaxID=5886 RepID=A0A8S1PIY0_PARPR|nr:unnamed protein product [Paramecium primaurelia]
MPEKEMIKRFQKIVSQKKLNRSMMEVENFRRSSLEKTILLHNEMKLRTCFILQPILRLYHSLSCYSSENKLCYYQMFHNLFPKQENTLTFKKKYGIVLLVSFY